MQNDSLCIETNLHIKHTTAINVKINLNMKKKVETYGVKLGYPISSESSFIHPLSTLYSSNLYFMAPIKPFNMYCR